MKAGAALAYLALMAAWIYGVFETDAYYDLWWIPLLLALHLGVGYAIARWWALVLPAAVPFLAIPAGDAENGDTPAAALLTFFVVPFALLLALGVLLARLRERRVT